MSLTTKNAWEKCEAKTKVARHSAPTLVLVISKLSVMYLGLLFETRQRDKWIEVNFRKMSDPDYSHNEILHLSQNYTACPNLDWHGYSLFGCYNTRLKAKIACKHSGFSTVVFLCKQNIHEIYYLNLNHIYSLLIQLHELVK